MRPKIGLASPHLDVRRVPIDWIMRTVVIFCLAALALQVTHAQQCSGQVSGVFWTPASRVPAATNQAVTVGFTVATALIQTDVVTITYPSGFVATTANPTVLPSTFTTPVTPGSKPQPNKAIKPAFLNLSW